MNVALKASEASKEGEGWRRLSWSRVSLLRSGLVALPRRSEEPPGDEPRRSHPPPVDRFPSQSDLIRVSLL